MSAAAWEPQPDLDIDGRWFRLVTDGTEEAPYGQYHCENDLVWAEFYPGGFLRSGRLVGRRQPDGAIRAAYCLLGTDGELITGECTSIPEVFRGTLRIADHWERADGSTGVSYIEEIAPPTAIKEA